MKPRSSRTGIPSKRSADWRILTIMTDNSVLQPSGAFGERPDPSNPHSIDEVEHIPRPVIVRAIDAPEWAVMAPHHHGLGQLVYAHLGTMVVTTETGVWVVPPQQAVWVPAGVVHGVQAQGPISMRHVYIRPGYAPNLPSECCVLTVSNLLRGLVLHAVTLPRLYDENGPQGRLMAVIADQIAAAPRAPLSLPLPTDPRVRKVTEAIRQNPADGRTLAAWSRSAGAGERTLARLFIRETGMTFGKWRQQARLLEAVTRLASGQSVTAIALDLGYASQSAFISVFRKAFGVTPGKYFRT